MALRRLSQHLSPVRHSKPRTQGEEDTASRYSSPSAPAGSASRNYRPRVISQRFKTAALSVFESNRFSRARNRGKTGDSQDSLIYTEWHNVDVALVGIEHAGKSTFYKQITSVFTPEDFNQLIWNDGKSQAVGTLLKITMTVLKKAFPELVTIESKRAAQVIFSNFPAYSLTKPVCDAVIELWSDVIFLSYYRSSAYYNDMDFIRTVKDCENLMDEKFEISKKMHLRLHNQTSGYNTVKFNVKNRKVRMWDVGGQWSQRTDWEYFLKKSNVVLFLASLTDYSAFSDDEEENALLDSLNMFKVLCESEFLQDMQIHIVFTKFDLFVEKLTRMKIGLNTSGMFPNAPKTFDIAQNIDFIKELYLKMADTEHSFLKRQDVQMQVISTYDDQQVREFFQKVVMSVESKRDEDPPSRSTNITEIITPMEAEQQAKTKRAQKSESSMHSATDGGSDNIPPPRNRGLSNGIKKIAFRISYKNRTSRPKSEKLTSMVEQELAQSSTQGNDLTNSSDQSAAKSLNGGNNFKRSSVSKLIRNSAQKVRQSMSTSIKKKENKSF